MPDRLVLLLVGAAFTVVFAALMAVRRHKQAAARKKRPKLALPVTNVPMTEEDEANHAYERAWRELRNLLEDTTSQNSKQYGLGGRFGNPLGFRLSVFASASYIVLVMSDQPDTETITRVLCHRTKAQVLRIVEDRLTRPRGFGVLPEQAQNQRTDGMELVGTSDIVRLTVRLADQDPGVALYRLGKLAAE
jgi:hypothetical protein